MRYWVDRDIAAKCAFQRVKYYVLFGQVFFVLSNHFRLTFSKLSRLQNFIYYISLGTVYLAIILHSVFLFLVVVFTFEFRDGGNARAGKGSDRRRE